MLGAQCLLPDSDGTLEERLGLLVASLVVDVASRLPG